MQCNTCLNPVFVSVLMSLMISQFSHHHQNSVTLPLRLIEQSRFTFYCSHFTNATAFNEVRAQRLYINTLQSWEWSDGSWPNCRNVTSLEVLKSCSRLNSGHLYIKKNDKALDQCPHFLIRGLLFKRPG